MTDQTLADLRAVRALLARPEAWTKGADARNMFGARTHAGCGDACAWSLSGAMGFVEDSCDLDPQDFEGRADRGDRLTRSVCAAMGHDGLVEWNDAADRTHADVLALLDRAIALEAANG